MRVFFLTRTKPDINGSGGAQIRFGQVTQLVKAGYKPTVVFPCDETVNYELDGITYIGLPNTRLEKIEYWKQKIGLNEDYLDHWVGKAFSFLKVEINSSDLIFATTGGELGMIKLGYLLKQRTGSKFVVNYHDPITYTSVFERRIDNKFHVCRNKFEKKYLQLADKIITSSNLNKSALEDKYPELCGRIFANYFGYIESRSSNEIKLTSGTPKIIYGGTFSDLQKPWQLLEFIPEVEGFQLHYYGNCPNKYKINLDPTRVIFNEGIDYYSYISKLEKDYDIGLVSLVSDYLGACVPSKIFEYINVGLPILGILPEGDAMEIVNKREYGIAVHYSDKDGIREALKNISKPENIEKYRRNILKDKKIWSMESLFKEVKVELDCL